MKATKEELRVLQLIDCLDAGGAENMAVFTANGLADKGVKTFLAATRHAGILASKIDGKVSFSILGKKKKIDIKAFFKLVNLVKLNNINIIHAHSNSIFWATLVRLLVPKIKVVWHIHYGNLKKVKRSYILLLKTLSHFWSYSIAVNENLKEWAVNIVGTKPAHTVFINNFLPSVVKFGSIVEMAPFIGDGLINLVCVANLKPVKDHDNLLDAFELVCRQKKGIHLHLFGASPQNDYGEAMLKKIKDHKHTENIHYWGVKQDVMSWLKYMDIGVIASSSEGLPVALLEYGFAGIKVVATCVGQIGKVMGDGRYGILVQPKESGELANAILETINDMGKANLKASLFQNEIKEHYTDQAIIGDLLQMYLQC